jgi:hypothetical protein
MGRMKWNILNKLSQIFGANVNSVHGNDFSGHSLKLYRRNEVELKFIEI